jgi:hypothetical protein
MIIKTFKANDIVTMKLVTGEEVISKFVESNDAGYTINKPLVLSITQNGVAMTPFLFTAEINGDINIPKNVVVAIASTDKSTSSQYIKGTTGIQPATTTDFGRLV